MKFAFGGPMKMCCVCKIFLSWKDLKTIEMSGTQTGGKTNERFYPEPKIRGFDPYEIPREWTMRDIEENKGVAATRKQFNAREFSYKGRGDEKKRRGVPRKTHNGRIGSRRMVAEGTVLETTGGLRIHDLFQDEKGGAWKSEKASNASAKTMNLDRTADGGENYYETKNFANKKKRSRRRFLRGKKKRSFRR